MMEMATYVENPDYYKTINLKDYQDWIKHYNYLPVSKRTSWLDLHQGHAMHGVPPLEQVLYCGKADEFGDKVIYSMQIIPEWAKYSDLINMAYEKTPKEPYKQNLHLVIVYIDTKNMDLECLSLNDFKKQMTKLSHSVSRNWKDETKWVNLSLKLMDV